MRRINGKLTAADRSGALILLAHNPTVGQLHWVRQTRRRYQHRRSCETRLQLAIGASCKIDDAGIAGGADGPHEVGRTVGYGPREIKRPSGPPRANLRLFQAPAG